MSTEYTAAEAEWFSALAAREAHDAQVARYWAGVTTPVDPKSEFAKRTRRQQGARRAHFTRRIIAAEARIDALTAR